MKFRFNLFIMHLKECLFQFDMILLTPVIIPNENFDSTGRN